MKVETDIIASIRVSQFDRTSCDQIDNVLQDFKTDVIVFIW
jgi:hypothetical protein